jgi:hypothetical protein
MLARKAALSRTYLCLFLVFKAVASDVEPATASHVRAVSRATCRSSEGRSSTLFHSFGQTKLPPFAQPTYFLGSSERP